MAKGISQETEIMLNELHKFVAFDNFWKNIKKCNQPATNPKFSIGSVVVVSSLSTNLVVSDICCSDNVNMYLLEYENNYVYKLIVSEWCISHAQQ